MRSIAPVRLKWYLPETEFEKKALSRQVSALHADAVLKYIRQAGLSSADKVKILQALGALSAD